METGFILEYLKKNGSNETNEIRLSTCLYGLLLYWNFSVVPHL